MSDEPRADVDVLQTRRRRLARAYADGGFTEAEYETRLAALDAEIRHASGTTPIEVYEAAELLGDLPAMWQETTPEERRRLLHPLIERVYVDVESKRIAGIEPVPAFKTLIDAGMQRTADCSAVLLAPDETPAHGGVDLVETGRPHLPKAVTRGLHLIHPVQPQWGGAWGVAWGHRAA